MRAAAQICGARAVLQICGPAAAAQKLVAGLAFSLAVRAVSPSQRSPLPPFHSTARARFTAARADGGGGRRWRCARDA